MGIISTLKELLGLETREPKRRRDVEVTVERKTDADAERAVKEPVASATASESGEAGAEADAGASETAEPSEEADAGEEPAPDTAASDTAEPGDAAEAADGPDDADAETAAEPADSAEEVTAEAETDAQAPPDEGPGAEPVTTIKGIGDAYAERLGAAGIETVASLAAADADEIAETADVPRARLERWIERAQDQQ
jgi:predicted flap endonuclease-1-like 5' DNA nuclease